MSTTQAARANGNQTNKRRQVLHVGSVAMIVGGVIAVMGSVMPWASTPFGTLYGTGGPGLWTLSAGFLAIAGALIPIRAVALGHAVIAGGGIAVIVVWQVARLVDLSIQTESWGKLLPGIGLVMAGGAAVILLRSAYRMWTAAP